MFVFDNVLTAGTVLVRQQIESQNYQSSGGTQGWVIEADGDATFNNVNLHGDLTSSNYVPGVSGYRLVWLTGSAELNDALIRGDLQSDNYVAGVSGWKLDDVGTAELLDALIRGTVESFNYAAGVDGWHIDENGNAEFNDAVIRGVFATGFAPGRRIQLEDSGGTSTIKFYSGNVLESSPGMLTQVVNALFMQSPDWTPGTPCELTMASSLSSTTGGDVSFGAGFPSPTNPGTFTIDDLNTSILKQLSAPRMRAQGGFDTLVAGINTTTFTAGAPSSADATITVAPASSRLVITVSARVSIDAQAGTTAEAAVLGFEIRQTNAAGAVLVAANDSNSAVCRSVTTIDSVSRTVLITQSNAATPLTGQLYIRAMFRVNNVSATAEFDDVWLVVQPSL